jgi:glycosyltransferase involved in cell wall biosynthesis
MKILEINKFYYRKAGADKHFLDLVELLENQGHQVAVFSMQHPNNLESIWEKYFLSTVGYVDGYNLIQKFKGIVRGFYSWEAKKKINQLLDDFQPEIVHIHNIYHQLSPAILFEIKKRKIPVVMTVHDFKIINPNHSLYLNGKNYDRCRNGKYYQCLLDRCYKNSYTQSFGAMLEAYWHNSILKTYKKNIDLYIAPSQFVRNTLIEWGINGEKINVINHFIPENNTKILQNTVINMSNRDNVRYAFYYGRISREKGVDTLLKIFSKLDRIKLYLAGSIEDGLELPKNGKVVYLGYLDQDELKKYISQSLFVVSGSKLPETFGLTALEAISRGKPFIGFNAGAFSEIIQNGENGYLAKNELELEKIILMMVDEKKEFNSDDMKEDSFFKFNSNIYFTKLMKIFSSLV